MTLVDEVYANLQYRKKVLKTELFTLYLHMKVIEKILLRKKDLKEKRY